MERGGGEVEDGGMCGVTIKGWTLFAVGVGVCVYVCVYEVGNYVCKLVSPSEE